MLKYHEISIYRNRTETGLFNLIVRITVEVNFDTFWKIAFENIVKMKHLLLIGKWLIFDAAFDIKLPILAFNHCQIVDLQVRL